MLPNDVVSMTRPVAKLFPFKTVGLIRFSRDNLEGRERLLFGNSSLATWEGSRAMFQLQNGMGQKYSIPAPPPLLQSQFFCEGLGTTVRGGKLQKSEFPLNVLLLKVPFRGTLAVTHSVPACQQSFADLLRWSGVMVPSPSGW